MKKPIDALFRDFWTFSKISEMIIDKSAMEIYPESAFKMRFS